MNILWISLARLSQAVIGLLALKLVTHWLSVEQFARLGLMTAFTSFFGLFLINPVGQYINRHTHEWYSLGLLVSYLKKYNIYISSLSVLAFLIAMLWLSSTFKDSPYPLYNIFFYSIALCISLWLGTWNNTLIPLLNMLGLRLSSIGLAFVTTAIGLLCSMALMQLKNESLLWFIGQAIGFLVGGLLALKIIYKACKPNAQATSARFIDTKMVLTYCLPLSISAGLLWILTGGYRFVIDTFWGPHNLGILILGFGIANQFWSIVEAISSQVILPKFYSHLSLGNKSHSISLFNNMLNSVIPIYLIMLGLGLGTCASLISLLIDNRYHSALFFCQIGMLSEFFRVIGSLLNQSSQIDKKPARNLISFFTASIFLLACFYILKTTQADFKFAPVIIMLSFSIACMFSAYSLYQISPPSPQCSTWLASALLGLTPIIINYLLNPLSSLAHVLNIAVCGLISLFYIIFFLRHSKPFHSLISSPLPYEK